MEIFKKLLLNGASYNLPITTDLAEVAQDIEAAVRDGRWIEVAVVKSDNLRMGDSPGSRFSFSNQLVKLRVNGKGVVTYGVFQHEFS
jgi:hypothetical protein